MYSTLRKDLEDMKACNTKVALAKVGLVRGQEEADKILIGVIQTLAQDIGDGDVENIAIAICIEYQKLKKRYA